MLILKRLAVWSIEILCQIPLLVAFIIALPGGLTQGIAMYDLRMALFAVLVFMLGSGYPLTTAIVAVFFRSHKGKGWVYPSITAVLFIAHEQWLVTGWAWPSATNLQIQVGGACIVFACTLVGGKLLRKWIRSTETQSESQRE